MRILAIAGEKPTFAYMHSSGEFSHNNTWKLEGFYVAYAAYLVSECFAA